MARVCLGLNIDALKAQSGPECRLGGGKRPLPFATVARVLALTCSEPPGETTHWTGRAMAKAVAISPRSVQRIWATHGLRNDATID